MTRRRTLTLCALLATTLAGCSTQTADDNAYATRGLRATDRTLGAGDASRDAASDRQQDTIAAIVNGTGIGWNAMQERMAERVGGAVLRELALEMLLEDACRREGVTITERDLERERRLLIDTLSDDNVARDDATREEILGTILRKRSMGQAGFRALLRRTAMSRALVRDRVNLTEQAIDRAHDLRYGTRYDARLIVTPTPDRTGEARRRLLAGEPFADVAAEFSTDASAARGGRIPPIHPADLSWPGTIREVVGRARIGAPTALVAVENGYAVLVVDRAYAPPSSGLTAAQEREIAARDARLEAERLLMARLARDLLARADVQIGDATLSRAWSASSSN